jgi:hypothetical protein
MKKRKDGRRVDGFPSFAIRAFFLETFYFLVVFGIGYLASISNL